MLKKFDNIVDNKYEIALMDETNTSNNIFTIIIDFLAKYWSLLMVGLLITIILIVLFCVLLNRQYVKESIYRMETNINTKKYIRNIYVEIDDTNEKLRCFSLAKMRKKIKKRLVYIFKDKSGKLLKRRISLLPIFMFPFFFKRIIRKTISFIDNNNNSFLDGKQNELSYAVMLNQYQKASLLKQLLYYNNLYSKNTLLIKGNAGSGKTNLICNYVDYLHKNKQHFVYINAKDVRGSIEDFYINTLVKKWVPTKIKNAALLLYLAIIRLFRKKLFIIIEGINENNNSHFDIETIEFIRKHNKKPFKLLLTTREEHYSKSFRESLETYFSPSFNQSIIVETINSPKTNDFEFNYVYRKYCDAFNFRGTISEQTKNIISQSFFLLRLFFELYRDNDDNVGINGPEDIFNEYLTRLNNKDHITLILFDKICKTMHENKKYDYVAFQDLLDDKITRKDIEKLVDENALFYKYIPVDNFKVKENIEAIFIVYDEFRDFLLYRYLLNHSSDVINDLSTIISSKSTVTEGVTKYTYNHFRFKKCFKQCNDIKNIDGFDFIRISTLRNYHANFSLITNYFVNIIDVPTDDELFYFDQESYADADILWDIALHNPRLRLLLLEKLVIYSIDHPGGRIENSISHNKKQSYYEWVLGQLKKEGLENKLLISFFKNLYVNAEDDYDSGYDSYSSPFIHRVSQDCIVYDGKKMISSKKVMNALSIKDNTYYGDKIKAIINYLYNPSWSLFCEYRRYYKKEFTSYSDYLAQVVKVYSDREANNSDLRCKYIFSNNDGSVSALLSNKEIARALGEEIKKYDY